MNKEAIINDLRGIWSALLQGNNVEIQCANLIFICIKSLEDWWFNIHYEKARPRYSERDQVEIFLSNIADL